MAGCAGATVRHARGHRSGAARGPADATFRARTRRAPFGLRSRPRARRARGIGERAGGTAGPCTGAAIAFTQYCDARGMTDRLAALSALVRSNAPQAAEGLRLYRQRFDGDAL